MDERESPFCQAGVLMPRPAKRAIESAEAPAPSSTRRARKPSRELGRIRFQLLLEAAEDLLRDQNPGDVGLYQIAERANISPGTVYHFFPTINAVFIALAEKYHQHFLALAAEPAPANRLISWQDLLIIRHERAVAYYNAHLPASKVLLGSLPSWELQQAQNQYDESVAPSVFGYFDQVFLMPHIKDPEPRFEIMFAIAGAIWSISFQRYGMINAWYAEEAMRACIAHCRTFLPERADPRPHVLEAAVRGDLISLTSK